MRPPSAPPCRAWSPSPAAADGSVSAFGMRTDRAAMTAAMPLTRTAAAKLKRNMARPCRSRSSRRSLGNGHLGLHDGGGPRDPRGQLFAERAPETHAGDGDEHEDDRVFDGR